MKRPTRISAFLKGFIYTSYQLGVFHHATAHRIRMLKLALSFIRDEKVEGDYLEFGVARGLTFISAYHVNRKLGSGIHTFYAFDSFEGFPETKGIDQSFQRFHEGEEAWTEREFRANLARKKVDMERVRIYRGFFRDTLTKKRQTEFQKQKVKIAIAWIDCDLYESTREVLAFIKPFLVQGSVLIFDDWLCYKGDPAKGEQRAVKEFLEQHQDIELVPFSRFGVVGNSFIVSTKQEYEISN